MFSAQTQEGDQNMCALLARLLRWLGPPPPPPRRYFSKSWEERMHRRASRRRPRGRWMAGRREPAGCTRNSAEADGSILLAPLALAVQRLAVQRLVPTSAATHDSQRACQCRAGGQCRQIVLAAGRQRQPAQQLDPCGDQVPRQPRYQVLAQLVGVHARVRIGHIGGQHGATAGIGVFAHDRVLHAGEVPQGRGSLEEVDGGRGELQLAVGPHADEAASPQAFGSQLGGLAGSGRLIPPGQSG